MSKKNFRSKFVPTQPDLENSKKKNSIVF